MTGQDEAVPGLTSGSSPRRVWIAQSVTSTGYGPLVNYKVHSGQDGAPAGSPHELRVGQSMTARKGASMVVVIFRITRVTENTLHVHRTWIGRFVRHWVPVIGRIPFIGSEVRVIDLDNS